MFDEYFIIRQCCFFFFFYFDLKVCDLCGMRLFFINGNSIFFFTKTSFPKLINLHEVN